MKLFLSVFIIFVMTACATTPASKQESKQVPPNHQIKYKEKTQEDNALILITRDSGSTGAACDSNIFINKELVGQVGPSEFMELYLPPGEYTVGAEQRGLCVGKLTELKTRVKANDKVDLGVGFRHGNGLVMDFVIYEKSAEH